MNDKAELILECVEDMFERDECEPYTESVTLGAALIGTAYAAFVASIFIIPIKEAIKFKKVLKNYEEENPDVIPLKKLKRKVFNVKSFEDKVDFTKENKSKLRKIFIYGKDATVWFKDDKPIIGAISDINGDGYVTNKKVKILLYNGIAKKHKKYYLTAVFSFFGVASGDINIWVQEEYKKLKNE